MRENLSPAQQRALKLMRDAYDKGQGYPGTAAFPISTARALFAKGLIEVRKPGGYGGTEVVSNAFGRGWHTRPVFHTPIVKLTEAGWKVANELEESA